MVLVVSFMDIDMKSKTGCVNNFFVYVVIVTITAVTFAYPPPLEPTHSLEPLRLGYSNESLGNYTQGVYDQVRANGLFSDCNTMGIDALMVANNMWNMHDFTRDPVTGEVTMQFVDQTGGTYQDWSFASEQRCNEITDLAASNGVGLIYTFYLGNGCNWRILNDVLGTDYNKTYVSGPVRYGNLGEVPVPSPLEIGFWKEILLASVRQHAQYSLNYPNLVSGMSWDVESYAVTDCPESYGGTKAVNNNESFDDLTFASVCDVMIRRGLLAANYNPFSVAAVGRYYTFKSLGLLEDYFAIQGELIEQKVARPLREELDKINPNFVFGIYGGPTTDYIGGFLRGLSSPQAPAFVVHYDAYGPSRWHMTDTKFVRNYFINKGVTNFISMPGFLVHARQLASTDLGLDVKRINHLDNGNFWLFSSEEFTLQKDWAYGGPEWGYSWWLWENGINYINAVNIANQDSVPLVDSEKYLSYKLAPAGTELLTGNMYYPGTDSNLPISVSFSTPPDILYCDDANGMFNGLTRSGEHQTAWEISGSDIGQTLDTVVDLSQQRNIKKILVAHMNHALYPAPYLDFSVSISTDGQSYTPLLQRTYDAANPISGQLEDETGLYATVNLDQNARYIKVSFTITGLATSQMGLNSIAINELAAWGTP